MLYKGGTVDERAVKAAGGSVLEGGNGVRVGGWIVSSHKGPITADAEMDDIKHSLGTLAAPEQFYGQNYLRLHHEASGATLSFTAMDALKGWLQDKSEPVRVEAAEEWQRSRQQDVAAHAAQTLEYDWTYTTSYAGTLSREADGSDGTGSSSGGKQQASAGAPSEETGAAADGEAGSAADGSAPRQQQQPGSANSSVAAAGASAAAAVPWRWEGTGEQINRGLLTSRDAILYYDEVQLYESELDDNGSCHVSVKVRVMPRCWYVLLRFWLRVDHVSVRLRETRVFCQFDSPPPPAARVLREVRFHEGTFAELRAAGAPAEGPAYSDADTAAAALMAVAPVGVKHYRLEQLAL